MRELELIERIRKTARGRSAGVRVGIGDDCAVLRVRAGEEMLVTTDFSLEGRHFRRDWHTAESAGHRCLARGLSDVAAMGGRPLAAFLSLALPQGYEVGWVDGFMRGLDELAKRFGVELAGGDTGEMVGEGIAADIVVVGTVREGKALLRSGARVGDAIYVTGKLGEAAEELQRVIGGERRGQGRHCFPEPRVAVGLALVGMATACIDLSDGIATDLRHLCVASGVRAELSSRRLPLGVGASLEQALSGGEDYELLFTARGTVPDSIAGVQVTRVGEVIAGDGVMMDGKALTAKGWEHFTEV